MNTFDRYARSTALLAMLSLAAILVWLGFTLFYQGPLTPVPSSSSIGAWQVSNTNVRP